MAVWAGLCARGASSCGSIITCVNEKIPGRSSGQTASGCLGRVVCQRCELLWFYTNVCKRKNPRPFLAPGIISNNHFFWRLGLTGLATFRAQPYGVPLFHFTVSTLRGLRLFLLQFFQPRPYGVCGVSEVKLHPLLLNLLIIG